VKLRVSQNARNLEDGRRHLAIFPEPEPESTVRFRFRLFWLIVSIIEVRRGPLSFFEVGSIIIVAKGLIRGWEEVEGM